ncbi:MAG: hypothetical protein WAT91_16840, partial [Saprospiraceae bacterium]
SFLKSGWLQSTPTLKKENWIAFLGGNLPELSFLKSGRFATAQTIEMIVKGFRNFSSQFTTTIKE